MKTTNKHLRGVTLVEIAIVLVIIGLLLGGILKGQELINNSRVSAIADSQAGLKASWYAFIDRYRGLPGDYIQAEQHLPGAGPARTGFPSGLNSGDGFMMRQESAIVFQHLTAAGFLKCPTCTSTGLTPPDLTNSPVNAYGGLVAIFHDDGLYATFLNSRQPRLSAQTGASIPSNIIRDVDLKIDDGLPATGDFRASRFTGTPLATAPENCITQAISTAVPTQHVNVATTLLGLNRNDLWRIANAGIWTSCAGSITF